MSQTAKRKCVFFDRDGIANVPAPGEGYITCPDDLHVLPEFIDALETAAANGFDAVIITNQQGVAKGLYSLEDLARMHEKLRRTVEENGVKLLDIYVCPHRATDGCGCRKPAPGLLLRAAADWNIDLAASWMVGDKPLDVEAGRRAGCRTLLVNPEPYPPAFVQIASIEQLPETLEYFLRRPAGSVRSPAAGSKER